MGRPGSNGLTDLGVLMTEIDVFTLSPSSECSRRSLLLEVLLFKKKGA